MMISSLSNDDEKNDNDDTFVVDALRSIPLERLKKKDDIITRKEYRNVVPLIRDERVLRMLIGSKRSWNYMNEIIPESKLDSEEKHCYGDDTLVKRRDFWLDKINALSYVAYENVTAAGAAANNSCGVKNTTTAIAYLPPYEYCSISMFNQAKLFDPFAVTSASVPSSSLLVNTLKKKNTSRCAAEKATTISSSKNGSFCSDLVCDRGGTIKSVLQSSKSFIHILTTHPLKNTFRAYIQIRPYLSFGDIGLPRHRAIRIFALNFARDANDEMLRRPDRCEACVVNKNKSSRRCIECPYWPDESFEYCFENTQNFALFLKRDPCIHNGSVVSIRRVYITDPSNDNVKHRESIYVSSFALKNLNADFDGDTVTVMIVRGLESVIETNECLAEPFLYGEPTTIRFTFCQSLVLRIFRRLCYDRFDQQHTLRCERFKALSLQITKNHRRRHPASIIKRILAKRLNLWANAKADARARRTMGPFYEFYKRVLSKVLPRQTDNKNHFVEFCKDWTSRIWSVPILDKVHALSLRSGHTDMLSWIMKSTGFSNDDHLVLLDDDPMCVENWLIVHSGAKSSPMELWNLNVRFREAVKSNSDYNYDDNSSSPLPSSSSAPLLLPHDDFFAECSTDRANEYTKYLNDFVSVSKSVPKSSYFASGLKWVAQKCVVRENNLFMGEKILLKNFSYFLQELDNEENTIIY